MNYEDKGDYSDDQSNRRSKQESIIYPKDMLNINNKKSPELEERLMMIVMSLENLLSRCQLKTKFTNFLSLLVEEYKEEQMLGKGKGITIQDTLTIGVRGIILPSSRGELPRHIVYCNHRENHPSIASASSFYYP